MTNYIFYHEVKPGVACPDGLASAWVAKRAMPDAYCFGRTYDDAREWPHHDGNHPGLPDDIFEGDTIYLVDYSISAKELQGFIEGVEVVVIDHHKTAWDNLKDAQWELGEDVKITFDMNECGASLCWKHFFPDEPMPVFLEYVKDRDLWNHALESTAEVHAAYAKLGRTFELYEKLAPMSRQEFLDFMVPIGKPAVEERKAKTKEIASRYTLGTVAGHEQIPFVALAEDGSEDWLTSDVCQSLYLSLPDAPFVACLVSSSNSWSLRSNKDAGNYDVGAVAKANGGGGHRNAAGFRASNAN